MHPHRRSFAVASLASALLALAGCGGAATTSVGETGDGGPPANPGPTPGPHDAGNGSDVSIPPPPSTCPLSGKQPPARPQPASCTTTPLYYDAGAPTSCTTDADCASDGGFSPLRYCLANKCSMDQCLKDGDCSAGTACACTSEIGGNAIHGNLCVSAQCRTDSDCSAGVCAPASGYRCSGGPMYVCPSKADTCEVNADCCDPSLPSCSYDPQLGHRACQAPVVCAG